MKKTLLAAVVASVFLSGCASIVSDNKYPLTVNSSPSEAYFVITNKKGIEINSGTTPTTLMLESSAGFFSAAEYTIKMKKVGYSEKTVVIKASLDGWYFGNILFGGPLGLLIIDPATGAMWKLPSVEYMQLAKAENASTNTSKLNIVSIDYLNEEEKSKLVRIN